MENESPKYLLYFDLEGTVSYDKTEFLTIRKFVKNMLSSRYYSLDLNIQFNEEIINYEGIRKDLSNNIMLLIGQIDDELVDDIIYEINCILGTEKVIRRRSLNDFNSTGYSDEQITGMYHDAIEESKSVQVFDEEYLEPFKILSDDFCFFNLPYLKEENYLSFCNLLIKNADNLDCFEMLQDLNVIEALFRNFKYVLKYFSLLDFEEVVKYYSKDTTKILRGIRNYVKQSEEYNDNIKELLLYKYILEQFTVKNYFYDPEEGFGKIREEIDNILNSHNQKLISDFDQKVKLFKNNYDIISLSDDNTKMFQGYKMIAQNIKKHFERLKPLLKSFRSIEGNFLKFNSKLNNSERNMITLDRLMRKRIVKDYTEKYGLYSITLESSEHIPFLQGKWFEYYTAGVCEDIIENYAKQGFYPDYQIYQNVMVQINGAKRELDIIIYLNGHIFYIENKIESKNTVKGDILKYYNNSENMNINPNNCFLVYLEGEDKLTEVIKVCSLPTFITKFKKEVLKILEEDKVNVLARLIENEKLEKANKEIKNLLDKEKKSLYLKNMIDYQDEERKFIRSIEKYEEEANKISYSQKKDFFNEFKLLIKEQDQYLQFVNKYEKLYLESIKTKKADLNLYVQMIEEIKAFGNDVKFAPFLERLYLLKGDFDHFIDISPINTINKLHILCGYGTDLEDYFIVVCSFLGSRNLYTLDNSSYLLVQYLKSINPKVLIKKVPYYEFMRVLVQYNENIKDILAKEIKNPKDNYLITRREREFVEMMIYTFMIKHFQCFELYGLRTDYVSDFLIRMVLNQQTFELNLKDDKIGNKLLPFSPIKKYYGEDKYLDLASYLFLNFKLLKEEHDSLINCDPETLVFEVSRTEQVAKLLKQCQTGFVISSFKEVKKANKYIGIFTNQDSYLWFLGSYWIGIYLAFYNESHYLYTNVSIHNDYTDFNILFIKELKMDLMVGIGKIINGEMKMGVIITSLKNINQDISNIDDNSFTLGMNEIKATCHKLLQEIGD